MKKILCIILALIIGCSLAACSDDGGGSSDQIAKVLDPMEYSLYLNVFQNGKGADYEGKTFVKEGIFTIIYDEYNSAVRYYVWGYSDETLCCDWQWEFIPRDESSLPPIGSRVKVTGTLVRNNKALDGYWHENAAVETLTEYTAASGAQDTTTMSPTLTRVQLINMINHASKYNDKPMKIYGRVASDNSIQHPYYNGAWVLTVDYAGDLPATGTFVTVTGKFSGTSKDDSKIVAESVVAD